MYVYPGPLFSKMQLPEWLRQVFPYLSSNVNQLGSRQLIWGSKETVGQVDQKLLENGWRCDFKILKPILRRNLS